MSLSPHHLCCKLIAIFVLCTAMQEILGLGHISEPASPQYLYMQRLHQLIYDKDSPISDFQSNTRDINSGGSLIATSMEAYEVGGRGINSEDKLTFGESKDLKMNFTIPNERGAGVIHNAELWFFPDLNQTMADSTTVIELTFFIRVLLPRATRERKEVINYRWRVDDSCVRLNITTLGKKIANNLHKKNRDKSNITIIVEVASVREVQQNIAVEETSADFEEVCSVLARRSTNTPFLAIKYFNENQALRSQTPVETGGEVHHRQKRNTLNVVDSGSSLTPKACSLAPLRVNITKIYGSFIVYPKEVDINECSGVCETLHSNFTFHAMTRERFKLVDQGSMTEYRETCCVPRSYKSLAVLIDKEDVYIITELPDMIATSCWCV